MYPAVGEVDFDTIDIGNLFAGIFGLDILEKTVYVESGLQLNLSLVD